MFIKAMGAVVTLRAQLNAETFSGNSDRNGATHCTKTNVEMPSPIAIALRLSKKWVRDEIEYQPARDEQPYDHGVAHRAPLAEDEARYPLDVFHLLFGLRRNLVEEEKVYEVDHRKQNGVDPVQRSFEVDYKKVCDRDEQEYDLYGVLVFELYLAQPLLSCACGKTWPPWRRS